MEDGERNYRPDRLIHEITLKNLLSFGPDTPPLKLGILNVLIGPNGSGKSNLIEAIGLLQAAPKSISQAVEEGGTLGDWVWKGGNAEEISLSVVLSAKNAIPALGHSMSIGQDEYTLQMTRESIEVIGSAEHPKSLLYQADHFMGEMKVDGKLKTIHLGSMDAGRSIIERRRDPESYPEISSLEDRYGDIRIYRDWRMGRQNVLRTPQAIKLRGDRLEEDFSNLLPFLNRKYGTNPVAKRKLVHVLATLFDGFSGYELVTESDNLQLYFSEGDISIRGKRLSDGSLRFLAMAAVLLDPDPPALICIEEPELGLHPDVVGKLAELLKEASKRTQVIVTTHSTMLVDAFTEAPECVIVFGKDKGCTTMKRLEAAQLEPWLRDYNDSLGKLWTSGEIGGNRW